MQHPDTAKSVGDLASVLRGLEKRDEAEEWERQAQEARGEP